MASERARTLASPNCSLSATREAHQGAHHGREALYTWLVEVTVTPGVESDG